MNLNEEPIHAYDLVLLLTKKGVGVPHFELGNLDSLGLISSGKKKGRVTEGEQLLHVSLSDHALP